MKYLILSFLCFFLNFFNQTPNCKFNVVENFDVLKIDNLGNFYLVKNDRLKKYNSKGELLKIYSNKKLGRIDAVDVSNPLRILLFYKDFAQVVFLDSQLSQNADGINLINYQLEQTDLICSSFNNGFWLFNRQNNELLRLNDRFEITTRTGNINVLFSLNSIPNYILESSGFLYLNLPNEGVFVFDQFGSFVKKIPIKNIEKFSVQEDELCFFKDSVLSFYHLKTLIQSDTIFRDRNLKDVFVTQNHFVKVFTDSICIP